MTERRQVQFQSQLDIIEDVESLAQGSVTILGGHTFEEIICHLAITNDMVTGKVTPPKLPLIMRLMMPLMRNSILNGPVKPGFKLPKHMEGFFWSDEKVELPDAIARLRASVERYESSGPLAAHPIFGKATREQIDSLTLKHAAMHLSHVVPN